MRPSTARRSPRPATSKPATGCRASRRAATSWPAPSPTTSATSRQRSAHRPSGARPRRARRGVRRRRPGRCAAPSRAAQEQRAELVKKLDTLKALKAQADAAEKKTADAARHHADVVAWDGIGEALAPSGIPSEILAEALDPINTRLQQSAADAEWLTVGINSDMSVTCGDRPYALLSESEQWRADAMLAEAISHVSGLRLLVLDRFDVLDLKGREDLLAWLDNGHGWRDRHRAALRHLEVASLRPAGGGCGRVDPSRPRRRHQGCRLNQFAGRYPLASPPSPPCLPAGGLFFNHHRRVHMNEYQAKEAAYAAHMRGQSVAAQVCLAAPCSAR